MGLSIVEGESRDDWQKKIHAAFPALRCYDVFFERRREDVHLARLRKFLGFLRFSGPGAVKTAPGAQNFISYKLIP